VLWGDGQTEHLLQLYEAVCLKGFVCFVCVCVCTYAKSKHRHVKLSKMRRALSANLCFTLYQRTTFEGLEAECLP
jgi:hypothetical protein